MKAQAMRRTSIVTAIFAAALLPSQSSVARDVSAEELAKFCSIHVRIADGSPHEATGAELFSSGMCIGYLKGYRDGVDGQNVFDVGGLVNCMPPENANRRPRTACRNPSVPNQRPAMVNI